MGAFSARVGRRSKLEDRRADVDPAPLANRGSDPLAMDLRSPRVPSHSPAWQESLGGSRRIEQTLRATVWACSWPGLLRRACASLEVDPWQTSR